MTRRLFLLLCALAACLTVLPALPASASAKAPAITLVSPTRVKVGGTLTIRGHGFSRRRTRNTLIFRAPNHQSVFVKPKRASSRKLVVRLPGTMQRLLSGSTASKRPTRFRIRPVVGRTFGKWTSGRTSPVVVPLGYRSSGGGSVSPVVACGGGSDSDGDLLSNTLELQIKTDPCLRDTDGDGIEDGYEEQSAIDLNHYPSTPPLPYPAKRPYPNALDPSDANTDYDGDGLSLREEHLMWVRFSADGVRRSGRPTSLSGLLYSDGLQKSVNPPPAAPSDPLANWALDADGDGVLLDDERDADGDGLGNWDEQHGPFTEEWWPKKHDGNDEPKESKYPEINFLDVEDLPEKDAAADADTDGDGVLDGADDNDHDGLSNAFEVRRPGNWLTELSANLDGNGDWIAGATPWGYTNPFNPCKPFNSERCHRAVPFGYYAGDGVPPVGPAPPAGYPDVHPDTPNG
jgi:hypothetical protein